MSIFTPMPRLRFARALVEILAAIIATAITVPVKTMSRLCVLVSLLVTSINTHAHETPIALFTLTERSTGEFIAFWNYSSSSNPFPPEPIFPSHCEYAYPQLDCGERGLVGSFRLLELGEKYSAAVVQINRKDQAPQSFTLTGASPSIQLTLDGKLSSAQVARSYIPLGFEHILLGVDHLLFVLGLMILVTRKWMAVKTITAFTIAHSLTLAAATLGWVGVPEKPVNAAIALSIVFIAIEILHFKQGKPSLSTRWPWAIAFGFGLLHGFGFSSALTEIGLPESQLPLALLFFNIGVELGQLSFLFLVYALVWSHRILHAQLPKRTEIIAAYGMGSIASYWFLSRIFMIISPA